MKTEHYFISDLHLFHKNVIRFTEDNYSHWPIKATHNDYRKCLGLTWKIPETPKTIEEWNQNIIDCWNAKVRDSDVVWVLGDISLKNIVDCMTLWETLASLNGQIRLIPGNHDNGFIDWIHKTNPDFVYEARDGKDSNIPKKTKLVIYPPYVKTHIPLPNGQGSQKVILSHYPIFSFDSCGFDAIHLYGHIHNFYEQIEDYHNALDKSTFSYSNDKVAKPKAYNVGCMNPWMNYTPKSLYEIQATFSGEAVYDTLVSVNDYWEFYRKNNIYYWEKHSAKEQNRIMLEWKELAKDDSFFAEMLKDFRKNVMGVEE